MIFCQSKKTEIDCDLSTTLPLHQTCKCAFFAVAKCMDKGESFCKPYQPYCKQIKEGGPHKAFMERNCCDSCNKVKPTGMSISFLTECLAMLSNDFAKKISKKELNT